MLNLCNRVAGTVTIGYSGLRVDLDTNPICRRKRQRPGLRHHNRQRLPMVMAADLSHRLGLIDAPVPERLRNAPTRLMKQLGYGQRYRYAHDEPDAYAAGETYLPDGMAEPCWYKPVPRGLEIRIAEKLERLRQLDREAGGG